MSSDDTDDTPPPPPAPALPGGETLSLAEQHAIDNAIAGGVWFLKDHVLASGTWGDEIPRVQVRGASVGLTALPALTLLECGVPADDPMVQKAAAFVREQAVRDDLETSVYQRSLTILFLDRLGEPKDEELISIWPFASWRGNIPARRWSYGCPLLDRKRVPEPPRVAQKPKMSLKNWRSAALKGIDFNVTNWDHSNTQFAVLALWVAQRHDVPVTATAQSCEKHFRRTQRADGPDPTGKNLDLGGSWLYDGNRNSSGWPTMTCSGLLALAVSHGLTSIKDQGKPMEDEAIKRALAMLSREIARDDDGRPHDYYFLWSLERVGVLYNLPRIGGKDWYAWGRKELLAKQQKDGAGPRTPSGAAMTSPIPASPCCF